MARSVPDGARPDGRLLSWSNDATLKLWDGESGACLETFHGHTNQVKGALALAAGRLLAWSGVATLRVWDSASGACLRTLEGHTRGVERVLEVQNQRLLSWSADRTLRLWDAENGVCLGMTSESEAATRHPEWLHAREAELNPASVVSGLFAESSVRSVALRHRTMPRPLAAWHADPEMQVSCLLADGTAVVTQANGQVCILKLHNGNRRMSLEGAEKLIGGNEGGRA